MDPAFIEDMIKKQKEAIERERLRDANRPRPEPPPPPQEEPKKIP